MSRKAYFPGVRFRSSQRPADRAWSAMTRSMILRGLCAIRTGGLRLARRHILAFRRRWRPALSRAPIRGREDGQQRLAVAGPGSHAFVQLPSLPVCPAQLLVADWAGSDPLGPPFGLRCGPGVQVQVELHQGQLRVLCQPGGGGVSKVSTGSSSPPGRQRPAGESGEQPRRPAARSGPGGFSRSRRHSPPGQPDRGRRPGKLCAMVLGVYPAPRMGLPAFGFTGPGG